jgi:hypothetical protein
MPMPLKCTNCVILSEDMVGSKSKICNARASQINKARLTTPTPTPTPTLETQPLSRTNRNGPNKLMTALRENGKRDQHE